MKTWVIVLVIVLLVLAGGAWYVMNNTHSSSPQQMQQTTQMSPSQAPAVATGNQVQIQNFAFSPASLTVKVGDKVTWTNKDAAGHSATADDNSFDTGVLTTGQSGTVILSKAGTYTYHCKVHPNMKATITVQ